MSIQKESTLRSHLLGLIVQPESHRGVYPYFDRQSVDFTKLTQYLYSVSSRPASINIMISDSYIDEMDMILIGLGKLITHELRAHFEQVFESARKCNFKKEIFNPKPWVALPIRSQFMLDSAPGVIPIVVNELEKGGLMKWCKDLCAKFGISPIHSMDLFPHIGSPPNPSNTTGSMDREMNEILKSIFNTNFDYSVVLIRVDV